MGLALLVIRCRAGYRGHFNAPALSAWVRSVGTAVRVVFIAVYASATVLFLSGPLLTLVGGALFGPVWGTF